VALVIIYAVLITRRAWLNDDAYITFRTIDNLVNGYRLTWNVTERVQVYTHPLWMFLVTIPYYFTREIFYTSIFLSLAVSFTTIILFAFLLPRTYTCAVLGIIALTLSNAFVDYSTSGLENPLTHLLIITFFIAYFRRKQSLNRLFLLSFIASLAALNRLDTFVFYLPVLIYELINYSEKYYKKITALGIGQIPLIVWESFSIFYYGFPFPNTYYAKLHTGIPSVALAQQGINYFINSFNWDLLTPVVIGASLILTIIFKQKKLYPITIGIVLYLLYIVKIGGDFMAGRFFSAPLLVAVVIISQMDFEKINQWFKAVIFTAIVTLGLLAPLPTYRLGNSSVDHLIDKNRIVDERVWYFWDSSLMGSRRGLDMPNVPGRTNGIGARNNVGDEMSYLPVINIGVFGYYAGPDVHVIDPLALADPLMSRLPAIRDVEWRVGHFERKIPDGYISSFFLRENVIDDKNLALFYDKMMIIVRNDLFDPLRLKEIWKMNTGQYDHLIDFDTYRYPDMKIIDYSEVSTPQKTGDNVSKSLVAFWDVGLEVRMEEPVYARSFTVTLESNDDYQLEFFSEGRLL